jgi:putative transcriptional regulator
VPIVPATAGLLAAALALAGLLPAGNAAQVRPLREPATRGAVDAIATGKLLVAARRLPDPNFASTVILLIDVDAKGAVGLVLNRRSAVTLAKVFPYLVPSMATAGPAFLGGPVEPTRPMALMRTAQPPPGTRPVVDGVHAAAAREAIDAAVAAGASPTRLRVFLGYAGWGAGQLQAETAEGAWHVLEGDADVVFDPEPGTTWQRQIARTEIIQVRHSAPAPRRAVTAGAD